MLVEATQSPSLAQFISKNKSCIPRHADSFLTIIVYFLFIFFVFTVDVFIAHRILLVRLMLSDLRVWPIPFHVHLQFLQTGVLQICGHTFTVRHRRLTEACVH